MSRIFHRPMFRKGGSTGGITSGLREGFANGGYPNPHLEDITTVEGVDYEEGQDGGVGADFETRDIVEDTIDTSTEKPDSDFLRGLWDAPELPKSTAGSDFLMNLGLNLVSGPSTGNIWSNIGEAGKEPLGQFQKARAGERALKYQASQAERRFQLDIYKAMNDEDKLNVQKEMEWYMSDSGGNMSKEDAFNAVMYRKPMHPKEQKRKEDEAKLKEQKENLNRLLDNYADDDLGQGIALTPEQGKKVQDFHNWAQENNKLFDPYEAVIDTNEIKIGQLTPNPDKSGNLMLPKDVDLDFYKPGFHYIDVGTNTVWMVSDSGVELIPVPMAE